jgi:15-cis-phytoene synthase
VASMHYCEQHIPAGSTLYYSARFSPKPIRDALIALYAFIYDISQIPFTVSENSVAEAKLNWWQSQVESFFEGQAEHPVLKSLLPIRELRTLSKTYFHMVISGSITMLYTDRYPTFDDLLSHAQNTHGAAACLVTEITGFTHRDSLRFANEMGMVYRLSEIIIGLRQGLGHHKLWLAEEDCKANGVIIDNLLIRQVQPYKLYYEIITNMLESIIKKHWHAYPLRINGLNYPI